MKKVVQTFSVIRERALVDLKEDPKGKFGGSGGLGLFNYPAHLYLISNLGFHWGALVLRCPHNSIISIATGPRLSLQSFESEIGSEGNKEIRIHRLKTQLNTMNSTIDPLPGHPTPSHD